MSGRPFLARIVLLVLLLSAATTNLSAQAAGTAGETLTNKSIISMASAGLPDDVIIAKIQASTVDFDLSTNGLMDLMQGKVSSTVIKAMLAHRATLLQRSALPSGTAAPAPSAPTAAVPVAQPSAVPAGVPAAAPIQPAAPTQTPPAAAPPAAAQPPAAAASLQPAPTSAQAAPTAAAVLAAAPAAQPAAPDMLDPVYPTEAGVYLVTEAKGKAPTFQMVEPTPFVLAKTGGLVGSLKGVATAGIASADKKAVIRGATAVAATTEKTPSFIFVWDNAPAGANPAGLTFGGIQRPNEFSLIAMDVVPNGREAILYATNSWGSQTGAQGAKGTYDLLFARIKAGVYRVNLKNALTAGEYCFVALGKDVASTTRLWDFTVR